MAYNRESTVRNINSGTYFFPPLFWNLWHYSCYFGILGLFVAVTSFTTSCGNRDVVRNQVLRLAMGTLVWFTFTSIFEIIEYRSGICSVTKYLSKQKCAAKGYRWKGFDISGMSWKKSWNFVYTIRNSFIFHKIFKTEFDSKVMFLPNWAHICCDEKIIFTNLCSHLFW